MPSELVTARIAKIADISAAVSKRYGDHEIRAVPFPSPSVISGWAFQPDEFEHGALIKLRALDETDTETLAERIVQEFTGYGFAPPPHLEEARALGLTDATVDENGRIVVIGIDAAANGDASALVAVAADGTVIDVTPAPKPRRSRAKKATEPVS